MKFEIVKGDILEQKVEVIVNSWNRNMIPWWLLLPQGVSGAIKKKGGLKPFKEISKHGSIPLGQARMTSAGELPFKAIIHVAGINMLWLATKYSVEHSVINAMSIVDSQSFQSVAFPLIGAGSGNRSTEWSKTVMCETLEKIDSKATAKLVLFTPSLKGK